MTGTSTFRLLSGDDATALAFLCQGGDGCISVTSGQMAKAQRLGNPFAQLTYALFREPNART
jgi:dihydrodipicolinate synthase/N-acetylneuraminate lyase